MNLAETPRGSSGVPITLCPVAFSPTILSDSDVVAVFRLRCEGWSASRLAKRFACSRTYIYDILIGRRRAGIAPDSHDRAQCLAAAKANSTRRKARRRATAALNKAVGDYLAGLSLRAAAARWGMRPGPLRLELIRRNIDRRTANTRTKPKEAT